MQRELEQSLGLILKSVRVFNVFLSSSYLLVSLMCPWASFSKLQIIVLAVSLYLAIFVHSSLILKIMLVTLTDTSCALMH